MILDDAPSAVGQQHQLTACKREGVCRSVDRCEASTSQHDKEDSMTFVSGQAYAPRSRALREAVHGSLEARAIEYIRQTIHTFSILAILND